jgi:hypothetical protein
MGMLSVDQRCLAVGGLARLQQQREPALAVERVGTEHRPQLQQVASPIAIFMHGTARHAHDHA